MVIQRILDPPVQAVRIKAGNEFILVYDGIGPHLAMKRPMSDIT